MLAWAATAAITCKARGTASGGIAAVSCNRGLVTAASCARHDRNAVVAFKQQRENDDSAEPGLGEEPRAERVARRKQMEEESVLAIW